MTNNTFIFQIIPVILLCCCSGPGSVENREKLGDDKSSVIDSLGNTEAQNQELLRAKENLESLDIKMIDIDGASFAIGIFEVTQKQWIKIMGTNPSKYQCEECPVTNVSWNDVQIFLQKLNEITKKSFRLPTESEWDYAHQGGKLNRGFRYSGSNHYTEVAMSADKVYLVGQKKPNQLGIFDMTGNADEWCSDWDSDWDNKLITNGDYYEQNRQKIYKYEVGKSSHNYIYESNDRLGFRLIEEK